MGASMMWLKSRLRTVRSTGRLEAGIRTWFTRVEVGSSIYCSQVVGIAMTGWITFRLLLDRPSTSHLSRESTSSLYLVDLFIHVRHPCFVAHHLLTKVEVLTRWFRTTYRYICSASFSSRLKCIEKRTRTNLWVLQPERTVDQSTVVDSLSLSLGERHGI